MRRECYANLCHGPPVIGVFVGIAPVVDLCKSIFCRIVHFQFHDINALWHFKNDVGTAHKKIVMTSTIGRKTQYFTLNLLFTIL